ncbi:DUF6923 family protein [Chondromyces crocatus]|uniref:DUF6923 domain-containing protein n=1 Tax=Chondromyces crocatus TaxID=52 RepID=A0A0K1EU57_CHOCO|nr:hypothetical protein [Chondromyces crocatus]AKT44182.1 uncharacterized protein CMC5_084220 [Chondromyces crocatus]
MHALRSLLGYGGLGLLAVGSLLLIGCSAEGGASSFSEGNGGNGQGGSQGVGGGLGGDLGFGGGTGGTHENAEVFAHSPSTLFRLDPTTKQITTVGEFKECRDQVIDIAIDEKGEMYGTTFGSLVRIDKTTGICTQIATGTYPNSLSFVPKGTVDPNEEALVGYQSADYVRIDKESGAITTLGSLITQSNPIGSYSSSGDIVSVIGGGTYLTVKGADCSDCIVEVDPTNGGLKRVIGRLNKREVYGLAFWGGAAYGFNNDGELFQINLQDGTSTDIPFPGASPLLQFWGAGSTTSAPLTPIE